MLSTEQTPRKIDGGSKKLSPGKLHFSGGVEVNVSPELHYPK
jgi:hypothetical protein